MQDHFQRNIDYLRISVTDLCNLRCRYCMPEEGVAKFSHEQILTIEEIEEITRACAQLGIRKVRLTGGEPLVRRGILDICRKIADIPGIEEVCMTTNGLLLSQYAKDLKDAGVNRLNISLDTLQNQTYKNITRCCTEEDPIEKIFEGIEQARAVGLAPIKINIVLMGGINDSEIRDFVELTKEQEFEIRFIELMPIGEAAGWEKSCFLPNDTVLERDPRLKPAGESGVARLYQVDGYRGKIGLISPVNHRFCEACNRIRLTADGKLKTCLHAKEETTIRGLHGGALVQAIQTQIEKKPQNYELGVDHPSSSLRNMNQIGG